MSLKLKLGTLRELFRKRLEFTGFSQVYTMRFLKIFSRLTTRAKVPFRLGSNYTQRKVLNLSEQVNIYSQRQIPTQRISTQPLYYMQRQQITSATINIG